MRNGARWRSNLLLAALLAIALVPAGAVVYLQYRALAQARRQRQQALLSNLRQAMIGVRVEAEDDFEEWPRRAMSGGDLHVYLRTGDLAGLQRAAEITRRSWPDISLFFGYRHVPGSPPEIFLFRPKEQWAMLPFQSEAIAANVRSVVFRVKETTSHFYADFYDVAGQPEQFFLHLLDDCPVEPKGPHVRKFGFYGFTVPVHAAVSGYLTGLLRKHLDILTANSGQIAQNQAVAAIFDQTGALLASSAPLNRTSLTVEERLSTAPGVLPGWTIRAGFRPDFLNRFDQANLTLSLLVEIAIAALLVASIFALTIALARQTQLSHAKTDFVASVSHELKTPLSVIRGFIEMLRLNRFNSSSQREEYFGIVDGEIRRLSTLIDRILESSKIDAGLKLYNPRSVDVSELIEDTLDSYAHELERRSFVLEMRIAKPLPLVQVDPEGFTLALLNILSNAVKYAGPVRRICIEAESKDGNVEVAVIDSGMGISKSDQRRIFDKFYRSAEIAAETGGAGLGLALVRHFARSHGGDVTVESTLGRGSTFRIILPSAK